MLRLNTLAAAVCLALLASCAPSDPEGVASAGSLRQKPMALGTTQPITVYWNGDHTTDPNCLDCRATAELHDSECITNSTRGTTAWLERPLPNPVPGAQVIGIEATVYGRLRATSDGDNKEQVYVRLNEQDIGNSNELTKVSCVTSRACDTGWTRRYPNSITSSTGIIPGFGDNNTLKVGVSAPDSNGGSSEYCLSHVVVTFTYRPRILTWLDGPADGHLRFGNQKKDTTSRALEVRVKNTGEAPVKAITPSIHDATGGTFTVSSTATFQLAPGETSAPFMVTFKPAPGGGPASATLSFTSNEPGYPAGKPTLDIPLSGTGVDSAVEESVTSITFDTPVRVGETSTPQPVTVRNVGNVPLPTDSFKITGVSMGLNEPFDVTPKTGFPMTVTAGTSGTPFAVTFKPTAEGVNQRGTLTIQTDDSLRPTITVSLTGTGVKPTIALDMDPVAFGPQRVGTDSDYMPVLVHNNGSERLTVNAVAIGSGPFELLSGAGFFVEPKGTPKEIKVRFKPRIEGEDQTGTLTFTTNEPGRTTANFTLKGSGVKSTIALAPDPVTFGPQRVGSDSDYMPVLVHNNGSERLDVTSVAISSGPFEVLSGAGFFVDPKGTPKEIKVRFKPRAEGENQPGILTFTTNEPGRTTANFDLKGTGVKPTIALEPNPVNFAPQRVGTDSEWMTVFVRNNGSERLDVNDVTISSGPFEVFSSAGFSVEAKGTPKDLKVRFKPRIEGENQTGTLTFTTNEPGRTTATFPLSGSGVKPNVVVTPATTPTSPLTFDDQRVLTTSGPKTVMVSNLTGSGPIRINSVSTGSEGIFTVSPSDPFTLEKGQSKPLSVTFRPTTETVIPGTLTLTTDYEPLSTITVSLSGKGIKPTLEVSTTELNFGTQGVGTRSTPKPVTVRNIGSGTLRITSINVNSPSYELDSNSTAPFDLTETNREKTLSVTFYPLAQDSIPGTLTLRTNDPENDPVTINLSGNGQTELKVTPSTIDFTSVRVGEVGERQVTFTNEGPVPITLNKVLFISDAQFSLEGLGTPVELKPGFSSIPLRVKYTPNRAGDVNAVIRVESTANNSPHTLSVSGKGTEARVQLSLPSYPGQTVLDFGNVEVNNTKQEMVRLTNIGGASLDVTSAKILSRLPDGGTVVSTSPFEYLGPGTSRNIAPDGGYIEVPVAFKPLANASFSATLVVGSNAVNTTVELPLLGNGAAARLSLSRTSIAFGPQRLGSPSAAQQLFITNEGKATLRIEGFSFTDPDFAVSSPTSLPSPTSPILVAAEGGRVAIDLRFTPTKRGTVSGSLKILSNDKESLSTLSLEGTGLDGLISVQIPDDGDIAFGAVEVGSSSPRELVRIKNEGDFQVTLGSARIQDPSEDNPFFITGFNSGLTLNPGDVHEFFVTFRPSVNGYQSATVVIQSDSWSTPKQNVTVSGTGEGAEVELLRTSINFGRSNVGTPPVPQSLNIRNRGARILEIRAISFENKPILDGGTAGTDDMSLDFSVGTTADGGSIFPIWVDGGAIVPVELRFAPTAVGLREARGVITSNAKTVKLDVSGQGTSPILTVEPPSLRIEGVLVGSTSTAQPIKITNTGDGSIRLENITLSQTGQAFTLTHSRLPITLDPKASETLLVTFTSTRERPSASAQLLVEPSLTSVPRILVPILGVGVLEPISVESELDFGQQLIDNTSLPRTLHIANNTDAIINLTEASVVGTDAALFKVETLPSSVEVVRGEPVQVNVTFRPRAEGDVNAVLQLSFAQLSPIEVPLRGKGIPKVLSISPSPLDFGGVRIGSGAREEPITFMNLSSDPITLGLPEVQFIDGEPFLFDWASLEGLQLQPGVPVIKKVKYQPTVESWSDTTLYFGTAIPLKPRAVEFKLKARATRRVFNADVTSLDFGRVGVNAPAQTRTVTVTNKSAQPQLVLLKLKAIEASAFAFDASGLSAAIPPEGSATFSVSFDPATAGEAENEVQVWLQGGTEPEVQIPVTGFGQALTVEGGGCACGTTETGSAGMLMLLALVGMGSRRRRRE